MSDRERILRRACLVAAAISLLLLSSTVVAQETPAPRADIFAGYAWMHPGGRVGTFELPNITPGLGINPTFNFNRWGGLSFDFGGHYGDNFRIATLMVGPRIKARKEHFEPFIEALFGLHRLSIDGLGTDNRVGAIVGGGVDIPVGRVLGLRLIQGDYVWGHHDFSPTILGTENLSGARLRSGLLFNLGGGGPPPAPLAASCTMNPTSIMAGEPVTMTTTASNIRKGHSVTYKFTTSGGKATQKDNTVAIDTTGLAPGRYTVNATVTDAKLKTPPATCGAGFTVQEPPKHPPTVSCSANPTTVQAGTPATVTATGQSPDSRPLTYNFSASAGRVTPSGTQATLDTAGAPAGPITVTCTATDDRGLNGSNTTTVNVEVPPPPPTASRLNQIDFKNPRLPARVDNEAKAILDDVALRLQREPDAKAVVIGNFDPKEKKGQSIAQQRAVNTKAYLTKEKGIDPGRIEVRTGSGGTRAAEIYLVPAGATFNLEGTQTFDETKIKAGRNAYPHARAPKGTRKRARKPAPATPKP